MRVSHTTANLRLWGGVKTFAIYDASLYDCRPGTSYVVVAGGGGGRL